MIQEEFNSLAALNASMLSRCEEYAKVTLPYVFPPKSTSSIPQELQSQLDSTGAQAVNFLTNKLILTLFPENQPFFRLQVSSTVLAQMTAAAKQGDEQAAQAIAEIDTALASKEREAVQRLGYTRFRTEATHTARLLIITGNAVMYHPENETAPQVYSLRDYVVRRDLSGVLLTLITKDSKSFGTFTTEIQDQLNAGRKKKYKSGDNITVYTKVELGGDGKYHLSQDADTVPLDAEGTWTKDELPWKVLCWNLIRGEDYGHGLVEDYFGTFHSLDILSRALLDGVSIAAEVKFLVAPESVLDVKELNNSESGSYHSGRKDDVSCIQLDKMMDFQFVASAVERLERTIAKVFLMNSSVTRNAERVTAEEIRYVAQELETANAGVYSRLALEWQYPTAVMLLRRVGTKITDDSEIQPQIVTGIDALSRAGDLDNLRALVADLSMLNAVPEEIRKAIDPVKFVQYCGLRRSVEYMKFTKSQAQLQAEQQQEAQMQQQLMASQAQADVAVEASKAAVRG